ncbi:ribonuclease III [Ramaria rubella]|nr:ribonuclease III [Ramaria rubella]
MSLTHYQQAINLAIAAVEYRPSLPNGLDEDILYKAFDWNKHRARNNSLEWLGDSLLYAAISAELFNQLPEGNESLYSNVRPHLLSNKTFALLTHKMGISTSLLHPSILKSRPPHPESKCYADLFEVIAAEIYFYASFDTLRDWVAEVFKPLIIAASGAFES